jgi:hypothetical protein
MLRHASIAPSRPRTNVRVEEVALAGERGQDWWTRMKRGSSAPLGASLRPRAASSRCPSCGIRVRGRRLVLRQLSTKPLDRQGTASDRPSDQSIGCSRDRSVPSREVRSALPISPRSPCSRRSAPSCLFLRANEPRRSLSLYVDTACMVIGRGLIRPYSDCSSVSATSRAILPSGQRDSVHDSSACRLPTSRTGAWRGAQD